MPEGDKHGRARTARADVRKGVGAVYDQLAQLEAERGALLASAIRAAERHRAAQAEASSSADDLSTLVCRLTELGMPPAAVAASLDISPGDLRHLASRRSASDRRGPQTPLLRRDV